MHKNFKSCGGKVKMKPDITNKVDTCNMVANALFPEKSLSSGAKDTDLYIHDINQ